MRGVLHQRDDFCLQFFVTMFRALSGHVEDVRGMLGHIVDSIARSGNRWANDRHRINFSIGGEDNAMSYVGPFEREFMKRTLTIVKEYQGEYDATLLLNCLLGLLIVP